MAKSLERLQAREMRRKGESIREIAKKLVISRSSASLWCRDIVLTEEQVHVLAEREQKGGAIGRSFAAAAKKEERLHRQELFAGFGANSVGKLSKRELLLVGLALYWAEGFKKRGRVIFVNSDSRMIILFISWVYMCFDVQLSQLTCRVAINEIHKYREQEILMYWSRVTKIPLAQFSKTTFIHTKLQKFYENMNTYFGVISISVRKSTNMKYQIVGGIDHLGEINNLMIQ